MKEYGLKPDDNIDGWVIDKHIGNGCVYSCHKEGYPEKKYAFKLREPQMEAYFHRELAIFDRIEKAGWHPSFQKLIDHCDDPERFYFVFSPLVTRDQNFYMASHEELSTTNPRIFLNRFMSAIEFGLSVNIPLRNFRKEHFFIIEGAIPFFIGLSDEAAPEGVIPDFTFRYIFQSFNRINPIRSL